MKKFFDSRREQGGSGAGSGTLGGSGGSGGPGTGYVGRVFNIGRHQVTVDEVLAEGYVSGSMISGSWRAVVPLGSTLARPHLEYYIPFWAPPFKKDTDELEDVQRRPAGMVKSLEAKPDEAFCL